MTEEVNGKMSSELNTAIRLFAETGRIDCLPTIHKIDGKTAQTAIGWTRICVLNDKRARQTATATAILDHLAELEKNGCQIQVTGGGGAWAARELKTGLSATGYSMADAIRQLANAVYMEFERNLPSSE